LSQRILPGPAPLESLEPRLLFAINLPAPPPTAMGVFVVGRTVFVNGSAGNDFIRIQKAPAATGGDERPTQIQVQVNSTQPVFRTRSLTRFIIDGFGGNDTIRIEGDLPEAFNPRAVFIRGGDGNDTLTGSRFNDKIIGGPGDDILIGMGGNDRLQGDAGNDSIDGGYGADRLDGGDGNDTLIGGPGPDRMFGGAGDDSFRNAETAAERQSGGRDLLDGGGGNDSAQYDFQDRRRLITTTVTT
jgi:Ca2+-binding RTX toxin-like protein